MGDGPNIKVVLMPRDQERRIADLDDDGEMILCVLGPKNWVVDFAASLANMAESWKFGDVEES